MRYLEVYFDGACGPINPGGVAKWGFAIIEEEQIIYQDHGTIGEGEGMTNNVAEYYGLIECLKYMAARHQDDLIEVRGDSKMVINMTTGLWGKKKPHKKFPHLQPLLFEARRLFSLLDNCSLHWIPREENELADSLSKM